LPDAAALITPRGPRIASRPRRCAFRCRRNAWWAKRSRLQHVHRFKTAAEEGGGTVEQGRARHATQLTVRARLAKVRRVLANVPTYMIFDDHDSPTTGT
jgi:hypothetical protein